jgi:hypothetical protein
MDHKPLPDINCGWGRMEVLGRRQWGPGATFLTIYSQLPSPCNPCFATHITDTQKWHPQPAKSISAPIPCYLLCLSRAALWFLLFVMAVAAVGSSPRGGRNRKKYSPHWFTLRSRMLVQSTPVTCHFGDGLSRNVTVITLWRRRSSTFDLRIHFIPQREHQPPLLQRSPG